MVVLKIAENRNYYLVIEKFSSMPMLTGLSSSDINTDGHPK